MSRITSHTSAALILALTFTSISAFSQSTSAASIPAAPIPLQIINGKNVFIANLVAENVAFTPVTEHRYYDAFYAAIKNSGRYHLVSTPEDADLVFQLRMVNGVQLTIIDPHSNIALWVINRGVSKPIPHSITDMEKSVQSMTVALAFDLQELIRSAGSPTMSGK